jgi:hypothetical protein
VEQELRALPVTSSPHNKVEPSCIIATKRDTEEPKLSTDSYVPFRTVFIVLSRVCWTFPTRDQQPRMTMQWVSGHPLVSSWMQLVIMDKNVKPPNGFA